MWVPAAVLAMLAALSLAAAAVTFAEGRPSGGERPSVAALVTQFVPPEPVTSPRVAAKSPSAPTSIRAPMRAPMRAPLRAQGPPQRVYIASLGIDAPVLPIFAEGNTLEPPPDPQDLGWWAGGAEPGAAQGTALITGHTVHDGGGALDDLETVGPGTEIGVRTSRGLIRYVAESVAVLDKDTIARRAPELFDQEVEGRLVLVTCEGWDGTGYRSNVVVTAVPLG